MWENISSPQIPIHGILWLIAILKGHLLPPSRVGCISGWGGGAFNTADPWAPLQTISAGEGEAGTDILKASLETLMTVTPLSQSILLPLQTCRLRISRLSASPFCFLCMRPSKLEQSEQVVVFQLVHKSLGLQVCLCVCVWGVSPGPPQG